MVKEVSFSDAIGSDFTTVYGRDILPSFKQSGYLLIPTLHRKAKPELVMLFLSGSGHTGVDAISS